jgi:hypothetical protein
VTLRDLYPLGQITDEGDTILQVRRLVKGRRPTFVPHWGPEIETTPADRVPGTTPPIPAPGRPELIMDLHADKKRTRSVQAADEFGNPSTFDGTYAYTSDNPALVNVTDNGDGSCVVAAVGGAGNLGVANLTFTATPTGGGAPIERVEAINVIAGGAETFVFNDGAEEEVTPDDEAPPAPPAPEV